MCKPKFSRSPLSVSAGLMALCGLLAALYPQDAQSQQCVVATTGALLVSGPYASQPTLIHVGETATISLAEVGNPASAPAPAIPNCTWTNLKAWVVYPNNSFAEFVDQTGAVTPPNTFFLCPGGVGCLGFPTTYVVQASDVGAGLSFATNWPPGGSSAFTLGGIPGAVQFLVAGAAGTTSGGGTARPQVSTSLTVINPCIGVTKNCVNTCTPIGQPIAFSGIVTNCGDTTLFNITLTDNPSATITNATTTSSGRTYDGTLQVGESVVYGGTYTPSGTGTALCGPLADTIQAVGADVTGFTVTNSATAVCHVQVNPSISLTKDCFKTGSPGVKDLQPGDSYVELFVVQNTGNVGLTGIIIHDDVQGNISVGNLAAGQSVTNTTGPITPPPGTCGPITDHATVTGTNACPFDATCPASISVTSAPVQCTVTVHCAPNICVTKGITCSPPTGGVCNGSLTYLSTDTGVAGPTNQSAFCYQIIVGNCLPSGDNLVVTNIHDNLISPLIGFETPFTLQPGQFRTNYYKQSYGVGNHTNSVVAIGFGEASGVVTNAQASASATVVPISVTCALHLTNDFQVNTSPVNNCDVQLPANATNSAVKVILTIDNTGQGDLNVSVIGGSILSSTPLVDCATGAAITPPVVFVAAGQTVVTNIGCVRVSCPGATISSVVQGSAVASASVPCVYDAAGNVVTTAPSSCENCVVCVPPVPCISVTKGIVCAPSSGAACDGSLTYGTSAIGMAGGTNRSAFCYQIIVSNCDTPDGANSEPLVVTSVSDNLLGSALVGFETPFTLQPGESRTNYYKQSYAVGTNVNTVIATGHGETSGTTTNAQDSATAIVLPVGLNCSLNLTNDFQVNTSPVEGCDVELAAATANAAIQVILTLRNTGQVDLNVSVVGGSVLNTLTDCGTGTSLTPPIVHVPAGETVVTNIGCVSVSCPGATISAQVQGTAVASSSVPCVFDTAGHAVTTPVSSCENCVKCETGFGCTPGFWKNCTQQWLNTGFSTGQPVSSVFTVPSCSGNLGSASLLAALSFKGGSGVTGASQILLRAAVAALLNSAKTTYPLSTAQVISEVNAALASCDRATILTLASALDGFNNLGCKDRNGNDFPCHATTPVAPQALNQQ